MSKSDESFLVCFNCGLIDPEKIIDGLNYEDRCEVNQVFVFDYKRINYFTEWLNQIQANEITEIPSTIQYCSVSSSGNSSPPIMVT